MIKVFTGLGVFSHPYDVEGQASAATIEGSPFFGTTNSNIVVDHVALPVLGNMNNPSLVNKVFPAIPSPVTVYAPPQVLPAPLSANPALAGPATPSFVTVTPQVDPQVFSEESSPASYETLFHDFDVDVYPTYNFWVADEDTNDRDAAGDRKLDDIPRFNRVVWNPAPDIRQKYDPRPSSSEKKSQRQPIMFGAETKRPKAVISKGITFAPEHLNNFQLVKSSLANGFVSPGTVRAVVELSHNATTVSDPVTSTDPYHYLDEDTFLQHPEFDGISLDEIRSNIHSLTNGALYAGRLASETVSVGSRDDQANLFSGKFSVEKPPTNGGIMRINGVHGAGGPALSFHVRTATTSEDNNASVTDPLLDFVQQIYPPAPDVPESTAQQARVNFVFPSLGGMLATEKVNSMQRPEHAETMTALAQFLPNLEVMNAAQTQNKPRQIEIPNFPSPPDLPHLEYVGYLVEKYERNQNGSFVLKETIDIPHQDYDTYIDSKIKYGVVYRYRVRAILRWTRPSYMGVEGPEPTLGVGHTSQTRAFSFYRSSYFHSEWSKTWAYGMVIDVVPPAPPDELQVRPDSIRKRMVVSFKLPQNDQRDIYYMRLFRKLQDADGNDLTGWIVIGQDWGPENVLYFDEDVDFYQNNHIRYVYCAQTVTRHNERSSLSTQLAARLNSDYVTYGEYPIEFVSQPGVKMEHHGAFASYPFRRFLSELVVPNDSEFSFSGRTANGNIALDGNQYYIRIESLDTGETKDYPIQITYNNLPTKVNRKSLALSAQGTKSKKAQETAPKRPMKEPVFRNWAPSKPIPRTVVTNRSMANRRNFMPSGIK